MREEKDHLYEIKQKVGWMETMIKTAESKQSYQGEDDDSQD